jgi:hypothetical protein
VDPLHLAESCASGEAVAGEYDGYLMSALSAAVNGRDVVAIAEILRHAEISMGA